MYKTNKRFAELQIKEITMDTEAVLKELMERKLVAIFRNVPSSKAAETARALEDGGVKFIEICFDQSAEDPMKLFEETFLAVKQAVGSAVHLGAGTVMTKEQLILLYKLGGELFVAPNTNIELIKLAKSFGMIAIPGAMSPSEIVEAYEAGADIVKLYVVDEPKTVKMLQGPLGYIPMEITCNVSLDTIPQFLAAGISAFGTKAMLPDAMINAGDFEGISRLAAEFSKAVIQ